MRGEEKGRERRGEGRETRKGEERRRDGRREEKGRERKMEWRREEGRGNGKWLCILATQLNEGQPIHCLLKRFTF